MTTSKQTPRQILTGCELKGHNASNSCKTAAKHEEIKTKLTLTFCSLLSAAVAQWLPLCLQQAALILKSKAGSPLLKSGSQAKSCSLFQEFCVLQRQKKSGPKVVQVTI